MIFQIDDTADEIYFPDPHLGESDGCFAVGGDLSIDRLLLAYSNGIFPWYSFRDQEEPLWFCPMKRFVIFPDEIHVSHSMRTLINKNRYSVGINEAFDQVIMECAKSNHRNEEDGAWLGMDIIQAYTNLHEQGFAASVEVWDKETDELVGGLYGVTIGKVFIGEYVLKGSFCLQTCPHLLSSLYERTWRKNDRLSVGNSPSEVDGWQVYFLRGIYENHE